MTIDEVMETIDDFCAADRAGCGVCEGICECREQDRDALRAAIQALVDEERRAAVLECKSVKRLAEYDGDHEVALGALRCMERIRARGGECG